MTPKYLIIHHSATRDSSQTFDWANIRRYHIFDRGWVDIGYHLGIEIVGIHKKQRRSNQIEWGYEILMGRMLNKVGAHCKQQRMNHKSLGICFVGNFDRQSPPKLQMDAGLMLIKSLTDIYKIPIENVLGHREASLDRRHCPGLYFDMDIFRENLKWQI